MNTILKIKIETCVVTLHHKLKFVRAHITTHDILLQIDKLLLRQQNLEKQLLRRQNVLEKTINYYVQQKDDHI